MTELGNEVKNFPISEINVDYHNNNFYRNNKKIEVINCCTNTDLIDTFYTNYIIIKRESFIYSIVLIMYNYNWVTTETIYNEKENKIYVWYSFYFKSKTKYKINNGVIIAYSDYSECEVNNFNIII